jgi:hypothetical protein
MTAVEWFNQEINKLNVGTDARVFIAKLFKQAKEMEKEQQGYSEDDMKKAFNSSSLTNMLDIYDSFEEFMEQIKNK